MIDITELPNMWRRVEARLEKAYCSMGGDTCADALGDAIPKWTNELYSYKWEPDDMRDGDFVWKESAWQPLFSIDYPPEESE